MNRRESWMVCREVVTTGGSDHKGRISLHMPAIIPTVE